MPRFKLARIYGSNIAAMAIKALVFSPEHGVRLEEREAVKESTEAIVSVSLAGICSTVSIC